MKHFIYAVYFISLSLLAGTVNAQQNNSIKPYGDIRIIYSGSSTDAHGFGGKSPFLRARAGFKYQANQYHGFAIRGAYMVTRDVNAPDFSLTANGSLAGDTFSFDELHYHFKDEKQQLKLGRFQKSFSLPTATANSINRFQSSSVSVNWSDGLFYQRNLARGWAAETVWEYQRRGHLSFPYKAPLSFSNNKHNLITYLGITNKNRDKNNFIEKTIAVMWAPDAYYYKGSYTSYAAVSGSAVLDLPIQNSQAGGSYRFTAELGQNVMAAFADGTVYALSAGIYDIAAKHNLMIEAAGNDTQWLSSPYAPGSNTYEIRYQLKVNSRFGADARYQVRVPRADGSPNVYSTFVRATYSF